MAEDLLKHFTTQQPVILERLRTLVEYESPSGDGARLDALAQFVAAELREIGMEITLFRHDSAGTNLLARWRGNHRADEKQLLIVGHLDTVWPVGTLARLPFRVTTEGAIHGPGVFDMKAGIAVIVEALRRLISHRQPTAHPIALLLTCDEEVGSATSRVLLEDEACQAVAALVLEPPLPGGIVKIGRKGIADFTLRVIGRAAHAGLDPTKGVNAVVELAHQTLRLAAMNDNSHGTTINVGVTQGGTTSNVVPAEASARIDIRFQTPAAWDAIAAQINSLTAVLPDAQLIIEGGLDRPPMPRSAGNLALYEQARQLAAELGFDLREASVGGGSDANFIAACGVPVLDGLGVDGDGAHAEHEHILLADIPRRAALLTSLMMRC
ncbi:MAG TPA: M20 family metallopeptidase [Blastocatellia bacterium]|nr:M20 family metallopeptidase [Blastocatellia bacterium]HMX24360.1 M20 family metallopeptidase [Blastocatellia bacterium]HMY72397.1 M20 family metallopeptidase [Blastocatellia bacterium]HMZ20366.1 M20 family metallopeptidase [Blastocatellia bacterium]HNG33185.1 M20 family metallopeptidase [Blastocatellia bacterium]